jgi:hypothetical protein
MSMRQGFVLAGLLVAFGAGYVVRGSVQVVPVVHAQTAASEKIWELRTYTAAPGKFDALNTRFRDHTLRLFAKHGVSNITYLTPTEGPMVGNTIIYTIPFSSRAVADKFWTAFMADPDWVKAKAASEANGMLTTNVARVWLKATDWSQVK